MRKGTHHSLESREKISESHKGKKMLPFSEEHKKKISDGNKGKIISIETRKKISKANKGRIVSEETKLKISQNAKTNPNFGMKGKHQSEEAKRKLSESHIGLFVGEKSPLYGTKWTEERKEKIRGKGNHNYGKHSWNYGLTKKTDERLLLSKETKEKIGKASKEVWKRPGLKEKMSKRVSGKNNPMYGVPSPNTGKIFSKEHRRKIGDGNRGKIRSEETREKLSKTRITNGSAKGEKNPNYQGGISFEPYTLDFNKRFKEAIRERDNYCCVVCNESQEELKRCLSIHHINYNKLLSIPQNCVSLCYICHSIVNFNRIAWTVFFQELLKERHNYKYTTEQKIILDYKEVM